MRANWKQPDLSVRLLSLLLVLSLVCVISWSNRMLSHHFKCNSLAFAITTILSPKSMQYFRRAVAYSQVMAASANTNTNGLMSTKWTLSNNIYNKGSKRYDLWCGRKGEKLCPSLSGGFRESCFSHDGVSGGGHYRSVFIVCYEN